MTPVAASFRVARASDIARCIVIRGRTRENAVPAARLAALGITEASWSSDVADGTLLGHVCECDGRIVAYCFGAARTGEVVVLAVLPDHEGQGLGKELLRLTMTSLHGAGRNRLFLGCSSDPRHRSYGFYRHLGWIPTGEKDAHGDDVLRYDFVVDDPVAGTRPR